MPGIVDFPSVVHDALWAFGDEFKNEPERRHFGEYLTGLLVAANKTVTGINAEFAETTDQSCLNRWLTEVSWDPQRLNERRLEWLQQKPQTRYAEHGVIALDNTLVNHEGKLIEDVGWYWDHADKRNVIAHDLLIANYVCPSSLHYPLDFRRFRKREDCAAKLAELQALPGGVAAASPEEQLLATFKDHTELFCELVDWIVARKIPGDFAFDCYFTSAEILNHLQGHGRAYVGDLKFNRKVEFKGHELKASELAAQIAPESRKLVQIGEKQQWYFTVTLRIPQVNHPVRIVILWDRKNGKEPVKMMITNRTFWEVTRILRVYRARWTGTETFHRDGKQHLGMGDCQLRSGAGQTRHMYLVILAHSLLVSQMQQGRVCEWARATLTTIGQACRAALRETLGKTITWVIEHATALGWDEGRIMAGLALA
jgi:hypothetical protein